MALPVSDRGSNKPELIEHAAEVIGRSAHRLSIFKAIYTGKRSIKTVKDLIKITKLSQNRVLDAGKKLATQDIVEQTKFNGETAYKKIDFFQTHRDKIIRLVKNPEQRKKLVTKRRPERAASRKEERIKVDFKIPKKIQKAVLLSVDDVDSFSKVRLVSGVTEYVRIPEKKFKKGVAKILGEKGEFNDWGGENSDLSSTRLTIDGRRRSAAFAFKGPGKTGKLTPGKMGKNGDQIQRLLKCPAEVFIVQYWKQIDDSVLEQLENFAKLKSYMDSKTIWYGLIDGIDSARLIKAYPKHFDVKDLKKH